MPKLELTEEQVKKIANLAKIAISEKETAIFKQQLSSILEFIDLLNEVDTTKTKPLSQSTGLENVFREDEIKPGLSQEEALSNAPATHHGYFKTKAVFE